MEVIKIVGKIPIIGPAIEEVITLHQVRVELNWQIQHLGSGASTELWQDRIDRIAAYYGYPPDWLKDIVDARLNNIPEHTPEEME